MEALILFVITACFHGAYAVSKACPYKPVDVVFVFDGSGSEGKTNFQKQLTFASNFTDQFEIGPNNTQVAAVTFGTYVHTEFALNKYSDKQSLLHAMDHVYYPNGETNTHLALHTVRAHTLQGQGARDGVSKLVIVLTDGHSLEESSTVREAISLKAMPDVTVVSIGIGNSVDRRELAIIASDSNHTFQVPNFDALHTLVDELVDSACSICKDDQAEVMFVLDASGSEGSRNFLRQLQFVNLIINDFSVGPNATQFGVVTFATTSRTEINLNTYSDRDALMQNVLKIQYLNGETYTHAGLDRARHSLTQGRYGSRLVTNKYCIVLTDGRSTEEALTIKSAGALHKAGVEVFTVGIGPNVDRVELNNIATDSNHTYFVHTFDELDTIHKAINNAICSKKNIIPTTTTTTTTTTIPTTTTKPECGQKPADILFLLDSSDSEGAENFQTQLDFVQRFASQFAIGTKNVLFSLATFSSDVNNHFFFNTYHSRHDVLHAIQTIPYTGLGTNTSLALKFARVESFKAEHGARANASRIVIVITDGRSYDPAATIAEANLLHKAAQVFSIGVGPKVDKAELQKIASNSHNVYQVDNFQLLHSIEKQLTDSACS